MSSSWSNLVTEWPENQIYKQFLPICGLVCPCDASFGWLYVTIGLNSEQAAVVVDIMENLVADKFQTKDWYSPMNTNTDDKRVIRS